MPLSSGAADDSAAPEGGRGRVFRYGLAALLGTMLWQVSGYVSFWLTSRRYGQAEAGVFYVFLLLGQPIVFLAGAAWAVIFSHVARVWSAGRRRAATLELETAYKAVVMATGGSGDVLTGIIAALLAVMPHALEGVALAAHLHGLAGDLAAERLGEISVTAGDILDFVPTAIQQHQRKGSP